jgi:hypothetical protein
MAEATNSVQLAKLRASRGMATAASTTIRPGGTARP